MNTEKELKKFEKRRSGIETLFDVIFLCELFGVIGGVGWKLLYVFKIAAYDIISYQQIICSIIISMMMFICTRLAHKGYFSAGIFGIIIAVLNLLFSGILFWIFGALLFIDSIVFLVKYNKNHTDTSNDKIKEKKLIISFFVLLIALVLVLVFSSIISNSKYTVSAGKTLKAREFYKYNVTALSKIERHSIGDSFSVDGDFIRLKVMVENIEKVNEINLTNTKMALVDENKNILYSENISTCFPPFDACIQSEDIAAGSMIEGYLYFYDSMNKNKESVANYYVTDYSKMANVKYLKISAFSDYENGQSVSKDYYLELE